MTIDRPSCCGRGHIVITCHTAHYAIRVREHERTSAERATKCKCLQSRQGQTSCLNESVIPRSGPISYRFILSQACCRVHSCHLALGISTHRLLASVFQLHTVLACRVTTHRNHHMRIFRRPYAACRFCRTPSFRVVPRDLSIGIQKRRFCDDSIATSNMSKVHPAKSKRIWWKECVVYQVRPSILVVDRSLYSSCLVADLSSFFPGHQR